jgi:Cu/Ag efflux protein CusF
MKNLIVIIVVSLLVFAFTSTFSEIGASEAVAQTTGKKSSAKLLKQVSGQVTALDREKKSITLEGITIRVDEEMLANIKEGDTVTIDYYTRDVHRAISILREVK